MATEAARCSFPGCSNQDKRHFGRCARHRLEAFQCEVDDCVGLRILGGTRCVVHRVVNTCAICGSKDLVRFARCTDHHAVPDYCVSCGHRRQNQEGLCSTCADTPALVVRVRQSLLPPPPPAPPVSVDEAALRFFGSDAVIATKKRKAPPCKTSGCPKKANYRGFCRQHGARCARDGCESPVDTGGFCFKHRARKPQCRVAGCTNFPKGRGKVCIRHGAVMAACSVPGCTNKGAYRGHRCRKHSFTTGACERCHIHQYERGGLCKQCRLAPAPFDAATDAPVSAASLAAPERLPVTR
ncbi:Hypothetical Protein FCC1311_097692 [Hondaea fermentalgiana]|uniref:Uncharacterized protein n=1 Tax=Hondaea fermentalgiana TaxID=2315210 RepID=A0A2R5GRN0_9STRA|nr:Hypothetical Protein FCC1311_097692 [Hondaea fermentalgiana]|eukprot:GBG33546.1 Hypothetical Protein FCC1311_097692 [Hondaea fermentalgiana]